MIYKRLKTLSRLKISCPLSAKKNIWIWKKYFRKEMKEKKDSVLLLENYDYQGMYQGITKVCTWEKYWWRLDLIVIKLQSQEKSAKISYCYISVTYWHIWHILIHIYTRKYWYIIHMTHYDTQWHIWHKLIHMTQIGV